MQVSLESVIESLVSFVRRVPTPINYTLLVLLHGFLFVGGCLTNGTGWVLIDIATKTSSAFGPPGAFGGLLHLFIFGSFVGIANIAWYKATF
jgi:hypothetical protein